MKVKNLLKATGLGVASFTVGAFIAATIVSANVPIPKTMLLPDPTPTETSEITITQKPTPAPTPARTPSPTLKPISELYDFIYQTERPEYTSPPASKPPQVQDLGTLIVSKDGTKVYFEPGGKQYKAIYNEGLEVEHLANVDSAWAYIRNGTTEGYIARSNLRGFEENSAASKATPKPTLRPTPKPTAKPTQAPAKSAYTAPYSETPVPTQAPQKKTYNYILNKNTGKFHYPSCSSVKQMKESNKVYFEGDRDEAMSRGYVPCKKCYP